MRKRSDLNPSILERLTHFGESGIHRWIARGLLVLMGLEWGWLFYQQQWLSLFLVTLILIALFSPILFKNQLQIELPAEFHMTAVLFAFASLYLGEIQQFYEQFWWWDIALHTSAGFLMGILGFLLVYLLNETHRVDLQLSPGFIAFFAFLFAITIGTIWEIFEFAGDQILGTNMQKPMLGDPSGLTDTMWDMIVNSAGAFAVTFTGWRYLKGKQDFFVKDWIRKFMERNPRLFRK